MSQCTSDEMRRAYLSGALRQSLHSSTRLFTRVFIVILRCRMQRMCRKLLARCRSIFTHPSGVYFPIFLRAFAPQRMTSWNELWTSNRKRRRNRLIARGMMDTKSRTVKWNAFSLILMIIYVTHAGVALRVAYLARALPFVLCSTIA